MSVTNKPDSSGKGSIISGSGWATRIHKGNDPLDEWFSIKEQKSGKRLALGTSSDFNAYVDSLLPEAMKNKE